MKNRIIVAVAALIALISLSADAARMFPIGVWYEGGVGAFRNNLIPDDPSAAAAMYQRDFADMAAHGVNAAVVPNTQPNHHRVLLDAAQTNKVKLIVELDKEGGELGQMVRGSLPVTDDNVQKTLDAKLKPIMSHPALLGVQLLDEPPASSFDRYAAIMSRVKAYAPRLQPFSCLIGSGGIESFSSTTKQGVAAFDAYPLGGKTPVGDKQSMLNYDHEAKCAVEGASKSSTDVWAVIQGHSWGQALRVPTSAEFRCMTYLALANGCKGIWWFLYQTECDANGKVEMQGLVGKDFKATPLWQEAGVLSREIRKLSPVLLDLQPADGGISVTSNAVAHVLKDSKGRLYVAIVNTDTCSKQVVSVTLDAAGIANQKPTVRRLPGSKAIKSSLQNGQLVWSEPMKPGHGAFYQVK